MSKTSSISTSTISIHNTKIKRKEIELKNSYLTETMAYFEFDEFVEEELARWIKYQTEAEAQPPIRFTEFARASYRSVKEKLVKLFT